MPGNEMYLSRVQKKVLENESDDVIDQQLDGTVEPSPLVTAETEHRKSMEASHLGMMKLGC